MRERRPRRDRSARAVFDKESWQPLTQVGKQVKSGEITNINQILDAGLPILEDQIVDSLLPELQSDLLMIGQSRGKFGGGQRRVFKQTQKKTREGNKPQFSTLAVVGNGDGYVGVGFGKSKETVPAREKAIRNAKRNLFKIRRGCGSWQCNCGESHTIPFKVEGKSGSVSIVLMPAPKGKGLIAETEVQKVLKLAGLKDIWSKTQGHTSTKSNLIHAVVAALKESMRVKVSTDQIKSCKIIEGMVKSEQPVVMTAQEIAKEGQE